MGDFNAKVGEGREENIVGPYGLGTRNLRGEKLVEWCNMNNLIIGNTWFQQPPRRKWTWKSPGEEIRNQIDFILLSHRFRNALLSAKSYPGADCYSDHAPVIAKYKLKLKKTHRKIINIKLNLATLKSNQAVQNNFETLGEAEEVDQQWEDFKAAEAHTTRLSKIRKRQATFFGHVMRREKSENLVTTGMLEGKRSRGKQREKLIEGLTDWLKAGKSLEAIEATKDRKKWRTMIANAVKQGT
ncbi:craniofacial development protein 2-like protein [Plakobranchus ocellatus]|uniref:Craniofacial development protein 2-like protein n=1 Tax=Plakobranchus ocellatus TaxID=259542 RepID=A0AAV4DGN1_9GAST|nr:craniofacial development protein 2-like protein [Plakobranchus ocellatus]